MPLVERIARGRLGLDGVVGLVGLEVERGVARCVGDDMRHERVVGGAVDVVLGALDGVLGVAVGDGDVGRALGEGVADLVQLPLDLEEAGAGLREGSRDGHADDRLVAVDGGDAHGLAVVVVGMDGLVVGGVELAGGVHADVAAGEVHFRRAGDGDAGDRLRGDRAGALDRPGSGLEGGDVDVLRAERLIDRLGLVASAGRILHRRQGGAGAGAGVPVVASGVEGHAGPGGGLELPGSDVPHVAGEGLGGKRREPRADVLLGIVGELDVDAAHAGCGDEDVERAGVLVVGPHIEVARVLDAVDGDGLDRGVGDRLAGGLVAGERDLGIGGRDVDRGGSGLGCAAVHVLGLDLHGEGVHRALVGRGVEELDAGGRDLVLAGLVLDRVLLGHVDQPCCRVELEAAAHGGVGVVLRCAPVGQRRARDVGAGAAHEVVGRVVEVVQNGMAHGVGFQRVAVVAHAVAVRVGPQAVERGRGDLSGVDRGGGDGQHVAALELVEARERFVQVGLDVGLVGGFLGLLGRGLGGDGLERGRAVGAVFVEGARDGGVGLGLEGRAAVLDFELCGLGSVAGEGRERVGEPAVVGRDLDGDVRPLVYLDRVGLGVLAGDGEAAVLARGERHGDGLGLCRRLRPGGRHRGRDQAERLAQGEDDGQGAHPEAPELRAGGMPAVACMLHLGIILSMFLAPAGRSRRGARNLRYVTQPVAGLHR